MRETACPHCNTRLRRHVDLITKTTHANGDYSLCTNCGHWCVFDDQSYGGMRKPFIREQRWLEANPRVAAITKGWRLWKMHKTKT
jgi:hypothetical protein